MLLMLLMQLRSHLRQGPCRLLLLKLQLLLQRGALLTPARQSMQTAQEQAQGLVACKRIACMHQPPVSATGVNPPLERATQVSRVFDRFATSTTGRSPSSGLSPSRGEHTGLRSGQLGAGEWDARFKRRSTYETVALSLSLASRSAIAACSFARCAPASACRAYTHG